MTVEVDQMHVEMDIVFETYRPISQEVGIEFWTMGHHFAAVPGNATYRLQTRGYADTLNDAIEGIVAQIILLIDKHYPQWPDPIINAVAGRRVL
jgi:hypothetical protein